jgi:hypothetical protein
MSQHDFNIANQGFPGFRSDLNNALEALATLSSGATEPATKFAYQHWVDTSTSPPTLKIRNGTNDGWISVTRLNSSTNVSTPVITTQSTSDNSTNPASTAYVINRIANDAPTKTGTGASGTWGISITGNAATVTNGITTGNIGSYAPSLTGTGASGTWGISITGNAATASNGGVTSVNGQTGAVTQTSVDSIGSYIVALYVPGTHPGTNSKPLSIGNTVAGSTLRYNFTANNVANNDFEGSRIIGSTTYDGGGSSLSGTWRCMGRPSYIQGTDSDSIPFYGWTTGLFVRVS